MKNILSKNKKGAGVVGSLINGVGGLIIAVVVVLLVVSTLLGAGLLTGTEKTTADNLSANFTSGIDQVALQIPTILKIAAIVILIGVVVFLAARARPAMNMGGGGTL